VFDDSTTQCLLFPEIFNKPTVFAVRSTEWQLRWRRHPAESCGRRYGLIQTLAGCLRDKRQAGKVDHSLRELLAQRVFSIACGYPDANDSARCRPTPFTRCLLDRDPVTGRNLASQPTLSRFENSIRRESSIVWAKHWPDRRDLASCPPAARTRPPRHHRS